MVAGAGSRLSGISGQVLTAHSALSSCAGAAAGTPAADALDGLVGHWAAVLPHFALSSATLTLALGGAANSYGATDAGVAIAAAGGGRR
jgi:hypothetical protein